MSMIIYLLSASCLISFCRDAIVTWIKKKIGPGIQNITTVEEAEQILSAENKVVLGFLNSLVVIACFFFWLAATNDFLLNKLNK